MPIDPGETYTDWDILQIMPADASWRAAYAMESAADGYPAVVYEVPLVAWAVVRVGYRSCQPPHDWVTTEPVHQRVEGLVVDDHRGVTPAGAAPDFLGYLSPHDHPSLLADAARNFVRRRLQAPAKAAEVGPR